MVRVDVVSRILRSTIDGGQLACFACVDCVDGTSSECDVVDSFSGTLLLRSYTQ